jgi:hypothetical protein
VTKVATAFYSAAVGHREINGIYMASFAIPGDPPQWVTDTDGKSPKHFRSAMEAELAGFRVMAAKLNRSRDVQSFMTKRPKNKTIQTYHAPPEQKVGPTVESVFGKKR